MFKKENIKGLSTIVATLLIVLIVLVATGIILVIIKEIIQKNKMNNIQTEIL